MKKSYYFVFVILGLVACSSTNNEAIFADGTPQIAGIPRWGQILSSTLTALRQNADSNPL
jgi:hypothetical protein